MRHFIAGIIPCDLAFVRKLPEVVYFRALVQIIHRVSNLSSWLAASLDICAFQGPLDSLDWCGRHRWWRDAGDESRFGHRRAATRTMHSYHNI